jgi:aminoglycoside phosphotransferase (APT) family kinase protein
VALGPWILIEDTYAGAPGCDGDAADIVRAKLAIQRATAKDLPALRALGLRARTDLQEPLASAPPVLLHGDLVCANTWRVERGVVLASWRQAALGPEAIDIATLARDLERSGRTGDADAVRAIYIAESEDPDASSLLAAAARALN